MSGSTLAQTNGTAEVKLEKVACIECGEKYDPVKEANRFFRTAEGVRCNNRPACRGRQLGAEFDKRGLKKWGRRTQEQLLLIMDCPPKGWDKSKKWESVNESHERVAAALELFSLCYPVCVLYAVQTDADGEPIKDPYTGGWKAHTHRSLGDVLALHQSTVSRDIQYLKLRHRVDYDDGRTWLDLDPKPLSISERNACTRPCARDGDPDDESVANYRTLLPSVRRHLAETLSAVDADACTRLLKVAADACTRQKSEWADARSRAAEAVRDACNAEVSLLSRVRECEDSSSSSEPPCSRDDAEPPLLTRSAAGKPAPTPSIPPPEEPLVSRPRSTQQRPAPAEVHIVSEAFQQWAIPDDAGIEELIVRCRQVRPDATVEEIAAMVNNKGRAIQNADKPIGMAWTAVPKMFGGSFDTIRAGLRQRAEQQPDNGAEILRLRSLLTDPDEETRSYARQRLEFYGEPVAALQPCNLFEPQEE